MFGKRCLSKTLLVLIATLFIPMSIYAEDDEDVFDTMFDRDYFIEREERSWFFGVGAGGLFGLLYPFEPDFAGVGYEIKMRFINRRVKSDKIGSFYIEYDIAFRHIKTEDGSLYDMLSLNGMQVGVSYKNHLSLPFVSGAVFTAINFAKYSPRFKDPSGDDLEEEYHDGSITRFPIGVEWFLGGNTVTINTFFAPMITTFKKEKGSGNLKLEYSADFSFDLGASLWIYLGR